MLPFWFTVPFLRSTILFIELLQEINDIRWLRAIVKLFSSFGVLDNSCFVDNKGRWSIASLRVNSHLKCDAVSDAGRERWIH